MKYSKNKKRGNTRDKLTAKIGFRRTDFARDELGIPDTKKKLARKKTKK